MDIRNNNYMVILVVPVKQTVRCLSVCVVSR